MKTLQNNTLGIVCLIAVPSTAEEFDKLAGRTGACLDEATMNVVYRVWNHKFRAALVKALEEKTGIERAYTEEGEGDKKTKKYTETEKVYVNRLLVNGAITDVELNSLGQTIAKDLPFDPSPSERSKKLPKEVENLVAQLLGAIEAGQSTADRVMENVAAKAGVENFVASFGEFGEESLGAALVAVSRKQAEEQKNALLA